MKVTVFNGSPRGRKSNSHLIVKSLLEGANEAGAQTEEVFLIEQDIRYCLGCFNCWGESPGQCVLKDDMAGMLGRYIDSDYVGLATPVYGMYMSGLLKNFTDRLLPLATPYIRKNKDGTFYHDHRGKQLPRQFFIANSGFPGEHNFDVLQAFFDVVKKMNPGNVIFEIYRSCGEVLQDSDERDDRLESKIGQFRGALKRAGREMVETNEVKEKTLEDINMQLITDEEYMSAANRHWDEQIIRTGR